MSAEAAPTLRSVPAGRQRFPDALPDLPVEIVGRHAEFGRIRELVADDGTRLVTLVGPGGVGKTTLATAVARQLWADHDGAVLYAPVTVATNPEGVLAAIAQCAGWDTDEAATRETVIRGLAAGPTLLVLDNCEQVSAIGSLLHELLSACPELVVLATSRRPAGITAEHLVAIEPFPVPEASVGVRELSANDAVTVLVNAARRRTPAFAVTRDNAPAIAELCRRLDGLPLALELAAARLHLLPPQQLVDLLAHRFEVLRVDTSERADRHRRLWATIDWSYQLLDPTDQARFRALGVFVDGFTLDAAAEVTGAGTVDMLDTLERLVAEHLVKTVPARAGVARFDLLESMREFALGELIRLDELAPTHETHAEWVRELAEQWGPGLIDGAAQSEAAAALDAERANVTVAVERSLEAEAHERVLAIGVALWRYWWYRGLARLGRTWLEAGLAQGPPATRETALAYVVTSDLAEVTGDLTRARQLILPALAIYEQLGLDEELAPAWNGLGFVERELGNLDGARRLHEQALELTRRLGLVRVQASALNGLGAVANRTGDQAAAVAHYREALALITELGDRYAAALVAQNLATALFAAGDLDTAIATLRDVLDESRSLGDVQNVTVTLLNLADCEVAAGQLEAAEEHLESAARSADESGIAHYPAVIAHHRGRIADRRGEIGTALGLFTAGLQVAVRVVRPIETVELLERIGALAAELGDDDAAALALGTARAGRAATGTPPYDDVAHWEQQLTERGVALDEPAGEWPEPAAAALPRLEQFTRNHVTARRAADGTPGEAIDVALARLGLTRREAEVARLVSARRTDQEIADELYLSVRTVTTHVSAILRKLGVSSRRDVADRLSSP